MSSIRFPTFAAFIGFPAVAFVLSASYGAARAGPMGAAGPPVRVGVAVGVDTAIALAGDEGLRLFDAQSGELLFTLTGPAEARVQRDGDRVRVSAEGGRPEPRENAPATRTYAAI